MRNPYLKEMNIFMALHWKDTLEANGFFALRDFTEWVRVVNADHPLFWIYTARNSLLLPDSVRVHVVQLSQPDRHDILFVKFLSECQCTI